MDGSWVVGAVAVVGVLIGTPIGWLLYRLFEGGLYEDDRDA